MPGPGLLLEQLTPVHATAYVEQLGRELSKPSVKQHLAATRRVTFTQDYVRHTRLDCHPECHPH